MFSTCFIVDLFTSFADERWEKLLRRISVSCTRIHTEIQMSITMSHWEQGERESSHYNAQIVFCSMFGLNIEQFQAFIFNVSVHTSAKARCHAMSVNVIASRIKLCVLMYQNPVTRFFHFLLLLLFVIKGAPLQKESRCVYNIRMLTSLHFLLAYSLACPLFEQNGSLSKSS